ncbi:MAG: DUF4132 domain-containing protein [bacterium]
MEAGWIQADDGYELSVDEGKIVCRNAKGAVLKSVPSKLKNSESYEQLRLALEWLGEHDRQCSETTDAWMLRSLSVPRAVLQNVWADTGWRKFLEHAIVSPAGAKDESDLGFFLGVDEKKGVGLVNIDGETIWVGVDSVTIPHPVLIPALDDFRELAAELEFKQGIQQLFREVHVKPKIDDEHSSSINSFADGKFDQLNFALGRCRTLGYPVRGGFACCPVFESGAYAEARYWIGSDDPMYETYTGELIWVDTRERQIPLEKVGPVAFSEGMRMASGIYAARAKEETEEQN